MDVKTDLLSAGEVARLLRSSRSYVYKVARAGTLGYVALGQEGPGRRTAMRFTRDAVATFLRSRTIHPRCGPNMADERGRTSSGCGSTHTGRQLR